MKNIRFVVLLALLLSACTSTGGLLSIAPMPQSMRDEPERFVVVTVRNAAQPLAMRAGATPRGYAGGQLYSATSAALATVRELQRDYRLNEVSAWPIPSLSVHCVVFSLPAESTAAGMIARLTKDSRVESAQPLNEFEVQGQPPARQPANPQPSYNDPYADLQKSLRELAIVSAHGWSRGAGIRVAIIDTGLDYEHPDLKDRVIARHDFVDRDERAFASDRHGTQVAGVIAADAGNRFGIVGIAPQASLVALKSCWHPDSGAAPAVCNSFTLAQALEAAMTAGVNIVNLSLSGPSDPLLSRLVRRGIERGILFVGAIAPAGIDGGFPAGVIGVMAVASAEDLPAKGEHLLAPGREILTLTPGGRFDFASGNSFAAAQVSGTLALILAAQPRLESQQAYRLLARTSRTLTLAHGITTSINACAALADLLKQPECPAPAKSIAAIDNPTTAPASKGDPD